MRLSRLLVCCLVLLAVGAVAAQEADPAVQAFRKKLDDKSLDKEKLRQEILHFIAEKPGTPTAVQAAGLLTGLPSPLDQLDAKNIPELDRFDWQPKELVAVLGEHRGRHGHPVTCVAWTRDGKHVLSGGTQSYIRCFDATTMRQQWLVGTGHYTTCLAVSRDSKTMAAGTAYGLLHVWDISGEKPVQTGQFTIGTSVVYGVDISPDGKLLAACLFDGLVHTFDLSGSKAKERTQLSGHKTPVRAVRFAPNSTRLAAAANDGSIRFWNFKADRIDEGGMVAAHTAAISCLRYHPQGNTLVAGTDDGHIVWINEGGMRPTKRAAFKTPSAITSIGYSNNNALTTSHADGLVRAWSGAAAPTVTMSVVGHYGAVVGFSYSPDGKMLATGGADWTVRQWPLAPSPKERFPLKGHWSLANSTQFTPLAGTLATGGEDRTARVWDLARNAPAQTAQFNKDNYAVSAVAHSPDGKTLAVGGSSTIVRLWDMTRRTELRAISNHPTSVSQLYYLPDGKRLLAASGKTVLLWNADTMRELSRFDGHDQRVNAMTLSPDGKYVLTGTGDYAYKDGKRVTIAGEYQYDDCSIRLWDVKDGKLKQEVTKQDKPISSLTFAPDGQSFACSMWYLPTSLWSVDANALSKKSVVKNTSVWAHIHVFAPDGKRVVTLGQDGKLRLTELATDKVLKEWTFAERIGHVSFSPDGRYLAVSIITGPVYVLRLEA